jgi:hypothetical protein
LGVTPGDNNAGVGMMMGYFPDELPVFFFGNVGNTAGIDNEDVGIAVFFHRFSPCIFQQVFQGGGF